MESKQLVKENLDWIKNHLKNTHLTDKQISIILDDDFVNNNPKFYLYYPFIFAQIFEYEDYLKLQKLSAAGYLYYRSVLIADAIVDKDKMAHDNINKYMEIYNICQEQALKILLELFPIDHVFWKYWNKRKVEFHYSSELSDKLVNSNNIKFGDYIKLADTKSAIGKIAIDAVYLLANGEKEIYRKIIYAHKYFSTGFQINDDIADLLIDFESSKFNIAYLELTKNQIFGTIKDNPELMMKAFHISNVSINLYYKSIKYFTKSSQIIITNQDLWLEIINNFIYFSNNHLRTINDYNKIVRYRTRMYKNIKEYEFINIEANSLMSNTINFVIKQYNTGCVDLKHIMLFEKSDGFCSKTETHSGDVFQRAIVGDFLINISNKFGLDFGDLLKDEINYLKSKKDKQTFGGWSYLPSCIDISADADDLGQIIQLFVKYYNGNIPKQIIADYFEIPIKTLLEDNTCEDGGIKTWIIPKECNDEVYKLRDYHNRTKWGVGPDLEVVANFLYSLYLLDHQKYSNNLNNGIGYILKNQNVNGYWESRWYYGNFYGTYVAIRFLLTRTINDSIKESLLLAENYLITMQNDDYGWGVGKSDPLSTSLAILTLILLDYDKLNDCISKGKQYLMDNIINEEYWNAVKFIKPKKGSYYSSKTLTTSFVLNALVS